MDIQNILDVLTPEEKKKIAERIYEEELRKQFQKDYEMRDQDIFHKRSTVYLRVLDQYISEMNLMHEDFIPYFKQLIMTEGSKLVQEDSDTMLRYAISSKLNKLGEEILDENHDELKEIIKEKVFKCCNETLLVAFLSDIVRHMELDKAVKRIILETQGDKK